MIKPIKRTELFRASPFADNLVANFQSSYASSLDPDFKSELAALQKYYDHRQAFHPLEAPITDDFVLVYDAENLESYTRQLPCLLQQFLGRLGISQLYLLDFLHTDLNKFPFENFRKQNQFKRLVGRHSQEYAYTLDVAELPRVLPLFFSSRKYDVPVIFLITAQGEVPLSVHLCDDGNLHISCQESYTEQIRQAGIETGFLAGDFTICSSYSVCYLDKK